MLWLLAVASGDWAGCIEQDTILRGAGKYALFTDLTAVGKTQGCFQQKCQSSDKFKAASEAECAQTCAKVDGCLFWSFGEEAGEKKCWLRTGDGGREGIKGPVSAARDCTPPSFPACIRQNTILRGQGKYAIFVDVTVAGKNTGCFQNNCKSTDKFDADSEADCASVCHQIGDCKNWAFGQENMVKKCWLRNGDGGAESLDTAVAGSRFCVPPEAFAIADTGALSAFKGVWSLTYTNGHRDTYTIDAHGSVRRAQGGDAGQLLPHSTASDQVKDPNYAGKFYLTKTHRPAVWEYLWLSADGQKLFLRHFCTDGVCTETSPEGSGDYCCSATGDRVSQGPEKLEL